MSVLTGEEAPKRTGRRPTGRPKADINWHYVAEMCEAGGNGVGIAATLGIDEGTLRKRCETDNKCTFSEFSQLKKAKGDELLKCKQFEVAMSGDKTMLIWLGKQRLGQAEKQEIAHSQGSMQNIEAYIRHQRDTNPLITIDELLECAKEAAIANNADWEVVRPKVMEKVQEITKVQ